MFVYYVFKALLFIHDKQWDLINTPWGYWYLVEVLGFVLVPAFMFAFGYRNRSLAVIKTAAVLAILGVILNRLNVSIIAFRWDEAVRYYPTWQEITVTLMVVFGEVWIFRWIVNRMPVFGGAH
jgi:DMSO reductase anchor subunit